MVSGDWALYSESGWFSAENAASLLPTMRAGMFRCARCAFECQPLDELEEDVALGPESVTGFMQIAHRNGDHNDHSPSNTEVVCPFCHLSDHFFDALLSGSAQLIYAPWISQADLNNLARALHVCMLDDQHYYASEAETVLSDLSRCAGDVKNYVRGYPTEGTHQENQALWARVVMSADSQIALRIPTLLRPLRLLPVSSSFSSALQFWASEVYSKIGKSKWETLIHARQ